MRRMLDPKEVGGDLPSTITFDKEGNRKVGKGLGVDGKLTLKSLVSESNPDGDITKELGGGSTPSQAVYPLFVYCKKSQGYFSFTLPSLKPITDTSGFFNNSEFAEKTGLTHLSVAASGSWNNHPVIGFVYDNNRMEIYYLKSTDQEVYSDTQYSIIFNFNN